jgi:ketosteroid isomerase-like protein
VTSDPGQLVEDYLTLCENRDLEAASRLLAPEPVIVFPGGRRYRRLEQMVSEAARRYRRLRKRREPPLVAAVAGGATLVVSRGTLEGEALDGTPFTDVRYVDLFLVREGLIQQQHVFNDLAEAGVVKGSQPATRTLDTLDPGGSMQTVPTSETPYRIPNRTPHQT